MLTSIIIVYNALRINKRKIYWLNLDNKEGVNTSLASLFVDIILLTLYISLK